MSSPLNPTGIDYTSRDFASLRSTMLAQAALAMPEWQGAVTGDPNDFGVLLVELFAYQGDILSYYNDVVGREAYLTTATQRSSVLDHARALGYVPRSASPASGTCTISVTTTALCVIPQGFRVATVSASGSPPLVFETQNDITFPASTTTPPTALSVDVQVVEGTTESDEVVGISTGALDQYYTLQHTPVISSSVRVRVVESPLDGGDYWFASNNLLGVDGEDNAFSYTLDGNDALTIFFGDGVNGRIPPRGSVIHVSYRVGGGADGNVIAGSIVNVVDATDVVFPQSDPSLPPLTLTTGSGIAPPLITVSNSAALDSGEDSETLDSIRVNAPRSLHALDRAVSLADYEVLAKNIPQQYIAKAKATGVVYSNIVLYVAATNGSQVSQDTLNTVVDYFSTRKMAGVSVVAATPTYVTVDIDVSVIIDNRYDQESVRLSSMQAVQNLLSFANVDFGYRVSMSEVYTAALAHPGVLNVVVSRLVRRATPALLGASDIPLRDNEIPVLGTVTVTATGGVVNSSVYTVAAGGTGSPSAPTAPTITLLRGDPNSVHVELAWLMGANTTSSSIQVDYLNDLGTTVLSTVVGPYSGQSAVFDLPLVGATTAATIRFTVHAFNNSIGPVVSPSTSTIYQFG